MKKKNIVMALIICMVIFTAGCMEKTDNTEKNDSAVSTETVQSETEIKETSRGALNVEGDAFTMDELAGKAGAAESDMLNLLGFDKKENSYETKLFGENTVITLSVEDELVKTITLVFDKTDPELLINAVSEQMGRDGEKEDDLTKWTCEDIIITLEQTDKGCVIEIHK